MEARSRARYLAPIALAATIGGTYLIVHAGLNPTDSPVPARHAGQAAGRHGKLSRARFYTVQAGDNLTSIAAKTGVPVGTIEALNPNLDPNALQTAQRLRLRR